MLKSIKKLKKRYAKAKEAEKGSTISCPSCGTAFIKVRKDSVFCKSKGKRVCNDHYWNNVIKTKRNNRTRISPASKLFMAARAVRGRIYKYDPSSYDLSYIRYRQEEEEFDFDGTWEAHYAHVERCEWCGFRDCKCDDA